MSSSFDRRSFLLAAAAVPLALTRAAQAAHTPEAAETTAHFRQLEKSLGGRLGVFALNTANHSQMCYRAGERFPICSTFKVLLTAAILARSERETGLMQRRIPYTRRDMVTYSPITEKRIGEGMTVAELCAAAIQYSDNTAANLLIKLLGGPVAVSVFANSIGDHQFRLDRWETALNTCIPGDLRDTSTPEAMGRSLEHLALGNALRPSQRTQFQNWLRGSTTGGTRIRAGTPAGWMVGDKTGTGDYGTANDLAVVWPPQRPAILIAIYTTQLEKNAKARNDIIAEATRVVLRWSR